MTKRLVWISGRAATGKSTLIAELTSWLRRSGYPHLVMGDEEIVMDLVRADTGHRHHVHPYGDDRMEVDGHLFDEGLRVLNARLLDALAAQEGPDLIFVELARGRRTSTIDVTYQRALEIIDPRLWTRSTVYRLDVPWPTQLIRNIRRNAEGAGPPNSVLRDLYSTDDHTAFTAAGIPLTTLQPVSAGEQAHVVFDDLDLLVTTNEARHVVRRRVLDHHMMDSL